jgi:hypothetical protein
VTYPEEKSEDDRGRRGFEALGVVLLSLATVGMAWCSYQASGWNTRSTKLSIQSSARGRDAATFRIKANQTFMLDVLVFSEYFQAHSVSNEPLVRFYARKFSPELKPAYEAWLRTEPFENANAPPNPFVTNLYQQPLLVRADAADEQSERLWNAAGEAARTDHQYTLISVLLAMALFFGGAAPRFETRRKRRLVLVLGLIALLTGTGMFLRLPRSKEGWSIPPEVPPEFIR